MGLLQISHVIAKRHNLMPLLLKNHDFRKEYIISFKELLFLKRHLFNNMEHQSMQILHDHTFLYIALTIGMSNILVPLFF